MSAADADADDDDDDADGIPSINHYVSGTRPSDAFCLFMYRLA